MYSNLNNYTAQNIFFKAVVTREGIIGKKSNIFCEIDNSFLPAIKTMKGRNLDKEGRGGRK